MEQVVRVGDIDNDRYDRSKRLGWFDIEKVKKAKVLVVGAGALGNETCKDLVLSGFRNITLVDMDRIVMSNLNRCIFFSEEDARKKRYKAEVMAEKLKIFPMALFRRMTSCWAALTISLQDCTLMHMHTTAGCHTSTAQHTAL